MSDLGESQTDVITTNIRGKNTLILWIYAYLSFARKTFRMTRHILSAFFPRRPIGSYLRTIIYIVILRYILSGMLGAALHLASQAQAVARNTRSIALAICAIPIPFTNLLCAGIRNEAHSPVELNMDHSPAWHPFLINEDLHGPAVDFALGKAANSTSVVLAFVRASDLPRRYEMSNKLKDFLHGAWASELSSAAHISLVKIVVDEMMLEIDAIFAKLRADLHPGILSRLMMSNWARQAEQAVLEALSISTDAITGHARLLVAHGEPVYNGLRFLESTAMDISILFASEGAAVQWEKEELEASMLTIFGGHRDAIRTLNGRVAELNLISRFWMEARVSLSLGIHAFNGVQSDLTALCEYQSGPKSARLHLPPDKQGLHMKGWVRRLEARRVLMPAQMRGN